MNSPLNHLIRAAAHGGAPLQALNDTVADLIPFNKPHGILILRINKEEILTELPLVNENINHIKSLHACGIAALCEFSCGLQLINLLGMDNYRIIMKTMQLEYFYQGKTAATVHFLFNETDAQRMNCELAEQESIVKRFELEARDSDANILCKATIDWQLKAWQKVQLKVGDR